MVAQQLYEGIHLGENGTQGLITYMRTDSTRISPVAQNDAAQFISNRFGANYSKHGNRVKIPVVPKMLTRLFVHLASIIHQKLLPNTLTRIS